MKNMLIIKLYVNDKYFRSAHDLNLNLYKIQFFYEKIKVTSFMGIHVKMTAD